jgi:mitochondrial fission protein ELM1
MHLVRICDGKRGHENQSLGLAEALARRAPVTRQDLTVSGRGILGSGALARQSAPQTDLVLGAGHATHPGVLRTARARSARSVILMKPSLPRSWFDLCIVPEHDGIDEDDHTWLSLGALNPVRPAAQKDPRLVLVLVGGPSRHNGWDCEQLVGQMEQLLPRLESALLVTSRRTPPSTAQRLHRLVGDALMRFDAVAPDWLAQTMPRASVIWVTEDSVSMAYEAASAGAAVGLLEVPGLRPGRTREALRALRQSARAVTLQDHLAGVPMVPPAQPLQEAERIAERLLARWPELCP